MAGRALIYCGILGCLAAGGLGQDLFLAVSPQDKPKPARPNLVWFLTDDQDQLLGASFPPALGATPMPKTLDLMQRQGAHATNWYIHTPICSPSRSELLSGRYFHNIKRTGGTGYCDGMHVNYSLVNPNTFVRVLHDKGGYATGMFGKYLNEMPNEPPPGFDAWLANDGGDYIAPTFQTKGISGLPDGQVKFTADAANYSTAVIGNTSINWIRQVAQNGKPFMAYIAPKAAHEPFNPAPWYVDYWHPSWPEHEPRPVNWNCSFESRRKHHGNIATEPMITDQASRVITGVFKNRWRTLMSVDDVIADVIQTISELGQLENTYFFYSSDHGFQLGEFNIPMDKRHVYEWDTKIHLLARGPGIAAGSSMAMPGTQVDIAPTLLGLAGLLAPPEMDGRSIVPFLVDGTSPDLLEATREHLIQIGELQSYAASWRQEVFIEYYYCAYNVKCTAPAKPSSGQCEPGEYPKRDSPCVDLVNNKDCWCEGKSPPPSDPTCYATEDPANNFIALRRLGSGHNDLYAEFQTGDLSTASVNFDRVDFVEYFDLEIDDWEMHNLATDELLAAERANLHRRLRLWLHCSGSSCP